MLTLVSPVIAIFTIIFRAGKIEEQLNHKIDRSQSATLVAIDSIRDTITSDLADIKQRLAVHVTDYSNRISALERRMEKIERNQEDIHLFMMSERFTRRGSVDE